MRLDNMCLHARLILCVQQLHFATPRLIDIYTGAILTIDVKTFFYVFNVFFIFQTFFYFKKRWQSSERQAD